MRSRTAAAVGVLAVAAALGAGAHRAEARPPMLVKKFLLGTTGYGTFQATGARGTQNAFRDNAVLLVFSRPVDFDSVDSRTIRIGIPSENGLLTPAEGFFHPVFNYRGKVYRNRVLFDPTGDASCPAMGSGAGFDADTTYSVTIPGADEGALKTVRTADGSPMDVSFTTTFRTTREYLFQRTGD